MDFLKKLNGIHRIQVIAVVAVFFMAAFSLSFVGDLYSLLPEGIVWLMVIINNFVVHAFANMGLDSPLWWGIGHGFSTAIVIALFLLILNHSVSWVYAGFKK
jgi:hypothetical protein